MKTSAEKSATTASVSQIARKPFIARAGAPGFFARASGAAAAVQTKLTVNTPGDAFEQEADRTADRVMRMPTPALDKEPPRQAANQVQRKPEEQILRAAQPDDQIRKKEDDKLQKAPAEEVQRDAAAGGGIGASGGAVGGSVQSAIQNGTGGHPLSTDVRGHMEPRFNADFSSVRVHHDSDAAKLSNQLSARAFTYQNHIFFARDQYQPGSSAGQHLLAHELTHTIQQGHSIQRSPQVSASAATPAVQRWGKQDALDKFAEWASVIPGFRMLTLLLGFNPINNRRTDRSAANLLRALIELIPGGSFITQALDNHGVINKAATWLEQKIATLGDIGGSIAAALNAFIDSLSWTDVFDLSGVWSRAKRIFTEPIDRLINFGKSTAAEILQMVKDAILKPLAAMAQGTRGYDLLCALLEEDPISHEHVDRSAENVLGGFMKLIGQEEIWENIKKGNAVARAWTWFQDALNGLMGMVYAIPGKIIGTLTSLTFEDVITVAGALKKVVGAFVNIAGDFLKWGLTTTWNLLEIIVDVVKPGLMDYIRKTGAALKSILKNPMPFLGNLIGAAKLGFNNFSSNIVPHLKKGVIEWLTGSLEGVYIPKAATLPELGKFALSVLGITWAQVRGKIVKALGNAGEKIMKGLEVAFDVVKALVEGGIGAVWDLIKEKLTDLKDQVISGIVSFVSETIVKKAIPKLISMFIPGAGFISAIMSIYDTIMVFVREIQKIARVVTAFIDSIVTIAAGNIGGAAKRVESILANMLSLAISFLAGFLGMGKITDKVMAVVQKVRASVDKALDAAIAWIVNKAKTLFAKLFSGKDRADDRTNEQKTKDKLAAIAEAERLVSKDKFDEHEVRRKLAPIKASYRLLTLDLIVVSKQDNIATFHFEASASDKEKSKDEQGKISDSDSFEPGEIKLDRAGWDNRKDAKVFINVMKAHKKKLEELEKIDQTMIAKEAPENEKVGDKKLYAPATALPNEKGTLVLDKTKIKTVEGKGKKTIKYSSWARRHILSSHDMLHHYQTALVKPHKKTVNETGEAIKHVEGKVNGKFGPTAKKQEMQPAAKKMLRAFHNEVDNLWVGSSLQNSSLQEDADPNPDMYDKHGKLEVEKLEDHIQKMTNKWGILGSHPVEVSNNHKLLEINLNFEVK